MVPIQYGLQEPDNTVCYSADKSERMSMLTGISTSSCVFLCVAGAVVGISCAVLILIFMFQRLGTSRIGFSYAPILLLWFTCNAAIGCYNIAAKYPAIFRVRSMRLTVFELL